MGFRTASLNRVRKTTQKTHGSREEKPPLVFESAGPSIDGATVAREAARREAFAFC